MLKSAGLPEGTPPAAAAAASPSLSGATVHYTLSDPSEEQPEVAVAELQGLIDGGTIGAQTKLWMEGWDQWLPLQECAETLGVKLAGALIAAAPASISRPLHLHIDRAAGLAAADTWGKSDPYVRRTSTSSLATQFLIQI